MLLKIRQSGGLELFCIAVYLTLPADSCFGVADFAGVWCPYKSGKKKKGIDWNKCVSIANVRWERQRMMKEGGRKRRDFEYDRFHRLCGRERARELVIKKRKIFLYEKVQRS